MIMYTYIPPLHPHHSYYRLVVTYDAMKKNTYMHAFINNYSCITLYYSL